jgi:hypothetical protein
MACDTLVPYYDMGISCGLPNEMGDIRVAGIVDGVSHFPCLFALAVPSICHKSV